MEEKFIMQTGTRLRIQTSLLWEASWLFPGKTAVSKDGKALDYDTDQFIKHIQAQYNESLK